jgi:hypothetical protein
MTYWCLGSDELSSIHEKLEEEYKAQFEKISPQKSIFELNLGCFLESQKEIYEDLIHQYEKYEKLHKVRLEKHNVAIDDLNYIKEIMKKREKQGFGS